MRYQRLKAYWEIECTSCKEKVFARFDEIPEGTRAGMAFLYECSKCGGKYAVKVKRTYL